MYEYIIIITSGKWWLPAKSLQMIWTSEGYQVQAGTLLLLAWLLRHGLWHLWWTRAFHLSLWLIFLLAAFKQFQRQSLESSTPLSEIQKWNALLHPNGPLTVTKVTVICTILGCTSLWWLPQAKGGVDLHLPWVVVWQSVDPNRPVVFSVDFRESCEWNRTSFQPKTLILYIYIYIYMYILRTCHWGS